MRMQSGIIRLLASAALCFAAGSIANAEVKTFEHFSIDVPAGWESVQNGSTVKVVPRDKSAFLAITVEPLKGRSLRDIAASYSARLKGSTPRREGSTYFFMFKDGAKDGTAILTSDGKKFALFQIVGENTGIAGIVDSMQER